MVHKPPPSLTDKDIGRIVREQGERVRSIASNLARRLPASVEREDLVQEGFVALMESMVRWTRATNGAHFEGYVSLRAQGAMLDALRAQDHASRHTRAQMRQVEGTIQKLSHTLGRRPREGEVAQALGLPLAQYQALLQKAEGYKLVCLDDLELAASEPGYLSACARQSLDPLVVLERSVFRQALLQALVGLGEQLQQVLHLYYGEGLRMHEIGAEMGLSESRVSQLHTHAIAELRAALLADDERFGMLQPRRAPRPQTGASSAPV
ncbi:MAG: sigma-70 family RNA polymerase sigma factor [Rhodoferax sp.]